MPDQVILIAPDAGRPALDFSSGLPADLLSQSAARLRILALMYACVFFLAGIFPALVIPTERARFLGTWYSGRERLAPPHARG
jgi:hypothetical protein